MKKNILLVVLIFTGVRADVSALELKKIYPFSTSLPGNILRFHFLFDEPVLSGDAASALRFTTADGKELHQIFLESPTELWNQDRTLLTVYLNPARIKQPLSAFRKNGPHFLPGDQITLNIDQRFRNNEGKLISDSYTYSFTVEKPVRGRPSPRQWKISTPEAGSRAMLMINFPVSMDLFTLKYGLNLVKGGQPMEGVIFQSRDGKAWGFRPDTPWQKVAYQIIVDRRIEDVCGNTLSGAFEWIPSDRVNRGQSENLFLTFSPGGQDFHST